MTNSPMIVTFSSTRDSLFPVSDPKVKDFTRKIRELNQLQKVFVRRDHIEKERIYRGITLVHVWRVFGVCLPMARSYRSGIPTLRFFGKDGTKTVDCSN